MAKETTLTFRCGHSTTAPAVHSAGHVNCYACNPELAKIPLDALCGACYADEFERKRKSEKP
jgi:hypothetical protein